MARLPNWEQLEGHARSLGWRVSRISKKRKFIKEGMGLLVTKIPAGWKIIYFRNGVIVDSDVGSEKAIKSLLYENLGTGLYF